MYIYKLSGATELPLGNLNYRNDDERGATVINERLVNQVVVVMIVMVDSGPCTVGETVQADPLW